MERYSVRPESAVENLRDDLPEVEEHSSIRPVGEFAKAEKAMEMEDRLVALLQAHGRENYKAAWQMLKEARRDGIDVEDSAELDAVVKEAMLSEMRDGNYIDLRWLGATVGTKLWSLGTDIADNPEWQAAAAEGVRKTLDAIDEAKREQQRLQRLVDAADQANSAALESEIDALSAKEERLKISIDELNSATGVVEMAMKNDPEIVERMKVMKQNIFDLFAFLERHKDHLHKINFSKEARKNGYDPDDGSEMLER